MNVRRIAIGATVLVALSLLPLTGAFAQDAASLIKQADDLWLKRSASDQNVREAIKLLEQAASADPKSEAAYVGMARDYYFLGRFAPKEKKEELFKKGIEAAKKALEIKPAGVGGNYWYTVNLAKSLEDKSSIAKMKHLGDIKKHMEASIAADPKYYMGGPYRVAGMLSFKSPLASNKEAIDYLRKSLALAPDYSLTLVNLAEVLIKEKQYDEAKKLLEKTLGLAPMPGFERELADDKAEAKKLLASIPK